MQSDPAGVAGELAGDVQDLVAQPLGLAAYHLARTRALNVDQPRSLAKTVTVE